MLFGNADVVTAAAAAMPRAAGVGVAGGLPGSADPVPAAAGGGGLAGHRAGPGAGGRAAAPAGCRAVPPGWAALLDWLEGQDGGSWQQRWLASGADAAGAAWWQLARDWLPAVPGSAVPAVAALVSALIAAICADIVRPSLAWLVSRQA